MIKMGSLFDDIQDKVLALIELDLTRAIDLFLTNVEFIHPTFVVEQVKSNVEELDLKAKQNQARLDASDNHELGPHALGGVKRNYKVTDQRKGLIDPNYYRQYSCNRIINELLTSDNVNIDSCAKLLILTNIAIRIFIIKSDNDANISNSSNIGCDVGLLEQIPDVVAMVGKEHILNENETNKKTDKTNKENEKFPKNSGSSTTRTDQATTLNQRDFDETLVLNTFIEHMNIDKLEHDKNKNKFSDNRDGTSLHGNKLKGLMDLVMDVVFTSYTMKLGPGNVTKLLKLILKKKYNISFDNIQKRIHLKNIISIRFNQDIRDANALSNNKFGHIARMYLYDRVITQRLRNMKVSNGNLSTAMKLLHDYQTDLNNNNNDNNNNGDGMKPESLIHLAYIGNFDLVRKLYNLVKNKYNIQTCDKLESNINGELCHIFGIDQKIVTKIKMERHMMILKKIKVIKLMKVTQLNL